MLALPPSARGSRPSDADGFLADGRFPADRRSRIGGGKLGAGSDGRVIVSTAVVARPANTCAMASAAADLATAGVRAGCEFDTPSAAPVLLQIIKLKKG